MHADNVNVDTDFDSLSYSYAYRNSASRNIAVWSERSLWCSVIEQAFIDIGVIIISQGRYSKTATDVPPPSGRKRDEALRWLLRDKHDFVFVCTLAGVSPSVIRRAARIFSAKNIE